jgi:2-desacetyl-2-hydroxyethyl bacteriochlorophyllide A dehydrogenase
MRALRLIADWEPRADYRPSEYEEETHRTTSASKVWRNPRLELSQLPEPTLGEHDVLIEVASCGICGSDMHMYESSADGYMLYPGLTRLPNVIGHEFAGRVAEAGARVRSLRRGDIVTVEEIQWCGRCTSCRRGYFNHCDNLEELGFSTPGAMAQYVAVDEKYCWKLDPIAERTGSEAEALTLGALVEPTAVSYHAMFARNQRYMPGNYCVVFGAGPIGLAAEALALAAGCALVVVVDPSESRRRTAAALGAHQLLDPAGVDIDQALLELSRGRGFDLVVEAAGAPEHTIARLRRSLNVDAAICHIGRSERPTALPLEDYQLRRAQVYGALGHSGQGAFQNVIRLIASGQLNLRPIISAVVPLDQALAAFKRLESREDAKILIQPNGAQK